MLQKDVEGGVVQDNDEIYPEVAILAGQEPSQARLVICGREALQIEVLDGRHDVGVGAPQAFQHPFDLVVRPLVPLMVRIEDEDGGRLHSRGPDRTRHSAIRLQDQKEYAEHTNPRSHGDIPKGPCHPYTFFIPSRATRPAGPDGARTGTSHEPKTLPNIGAEREFTAFADEVDNSRATGQTISNHSIWLAIRSCFAGRISSSS